MKDDKAKTTPACEPCERDFERNVHRIVREGKGESPKVHERKRHEVHSAFDQHKHKDQHK